MKQKLFKLIKGVFLFNLTGWALDGAIDSVQVRHNVKKGELDKKYVKTEYIWVSVIKKFIKLCKEW